VRSIASKLLAVHTSLRRVRDKANYGIKNFKWIDEFIGTKPIIKRRKSLVLKYNLEAPGIWGPHKPKGTPA
jgi:hypothetical protein